MSFINKNSINYCLTRAQLINVRQISLLLSLTLNDCFARGSQWIARKMAGKPQMEHSVSATRMA